MNYRIFKLKELDFKEAYHLMISGIIPRPIAYVGTSDSENNHNLAPYSFYNGFGANPPIVGFSPALSGRTGMPKDTLMNIKSTQNFTISLVSYNIVHQMSLSSSEYADNIDEFVKSGLSKFICSNNMPAVNESPYIMECSLYNIIELGNKPASGNLILGKVDKIYVDSNAYTDDKIDPIKLDPVSRLGYNYYSRANKGIFTIDKPRGLCIGIDSLPKFVKNSNNFTGNELGKLGSVIEIPQKSHLGNYTELKIDDLYDECKLALKSDKINYAWQIIHAISEKLDEK